MIRRIALCSVMLAAGLLAAPPAYGQDAEPRKNFTSMINVDALIDNYARFLARKYNLNEEQDAFTQQLLHKRADEFLAKNETDLRELVDRLFEVRTGGEMTPEELVTWGSRITPIYDEAKKIIVSGNDEWRGILNEEQRRIHDEDLRIMHEGFATTDEQLGRIVNGEMTLEEFRNPNRANRHKGARQREEAQPVDPQPPVNDPPPVGEVREPQPGDVTPGLADETPAQPDEQSKDVQQPDGGGQQADPGHPDIQPAPVGRPDRPRPERQPVGRAAAAKPESEWATYVRQFIERYKLDEAQKQRAATILRDCEAQAERLMRSRTAELERIDKRLGEIRGNKDAAKESSELTEKRTKLMEPIGQIFEKQLKPRLEKLPTTTQRKEAEAARAKKAEPAGGKKAENPRK